MTLEPLKPTDQLASDKASLPAAGKGKVSLFKFITDLGHYIFNPKSNAASLSQDISALEAERAAARAAESELNKKSKQDKQARFATEYKSLTASHDLKSKVKETNQAPVKEDIFTMPLVVSKPSVSSSTATTKQDSVRPVTTNLSPVAKPIEREQAKSIPPVVPKAEVLTKVEDQAKHKAAFLDKKAKAAHALSVERTKHTKQILKSKIENRPWNPHGLVQVNLIKEHRSMFFNWQSKMLSMIFFVVLTCLICVLAYGYLLILEKEKQNSNLYIFANLDSVNKQIAVVRRELDEKIVPFNDKLMYTGYMLDNHIYWTNFFQLLEQDTLADVYYSSGIDAGITGNVKGTNGLFEIWSIAKDYNTISNQTKVMTKSKSARVLAADVSDTDALSRASSTVDQIGSLPSNASQAVRFKLKLTIDQRLFLRDK